MYISQDPIRLDGGLNLYSYVGDPNGWVDFFGLNKKTYSVYHLYDVDPVTGVQSKDPYYVGITEDVTTRTQNHKDSGRLTNDGSTTLEVQRSRLSEAQARGIEQAHIDHYGTNVGDKKGIRKGTVMADGTIHDGKISQSNRGNKNNSFVENNTRDAKRQQEMVDARNNEKVRLCGG